MEEIAKEEKKEEKKEEEKEGNQRLKWALAS
jgi:hypothetical protein